MGSQERGNPSVSRHRDCVEPGCGTAVYCRDRCQRHYNRDVRNGTLVLDMEYHDPKPARSCHVLIPVTGLACGRDVRHDKNGGKGMCGVHYQRWKKHGDPLYVVPPATAVECAYHGCSKAAAARGLCPTHWRRWRKHSDPSIVAKPDLSRRPPSHRRGIELGSKRWSCGHSRRCDCPDSVVSCSGCEVVRPKSEYPMANRLYVSTTCRSCLAKRRRDRRASDPEAALRDREARTRSYQRTDRVLRCLRARTYEHLRSNLPGGHTVAEAIALFERYRWTCGYCQKRPATDMDHIIPAILHGMERECRRLGVGPPTDNIDNLMPACGVCNGAKGSRTVDQWRRGEPMVRRGDLEFPARLHKSMRGHRPDTLRLYSRILGLLDVGLSGVDVARQLNTNQAAVSNAVKWAGRPPLQRIRKPTRLCTHPGCLRPHKGRGLCQGHLQQVKRGVVLTPLRSTARVANRSVAPPSYPRAAASQGGSEAPRPPRNAVA